MLRDRTTQPAEQGRRGEMGECVQQHFVRDESLTADRAVMRRTVQVKTKRSGGKKESMMSYRKLSCDRREVM